MDFECNSRVEKIPYNGKETIVDGEKYDSMHGNSDRHLQEKLLPYRRRLFFWNTCSKKSRIYDKII